MYFRMYYCSPLLLLLLIFAASSEASHPPPLSTASNPYDILQRHGLPIGLLPKGITDFCIDADGRFEANLPEDCTARFETDVHYDRNVTGTLIYGEIDAISGVSAQELFLWFPVRGIRVDVPSSGLIYFDVGVIHKQFSLSLFETPPDCSPASRDCLLEGSHIARIVSKSQSGKVRYDLDQDFDGLRSIV